MWLQWVEAPGDYLVVWGDGQTDLMQAAQRPVRHRYAAPGVYDIACVARDDPGAVVTAAVAVGRAEPEVELQVSAGGEATVSIGALEACDRYRVRWNDSREGPVVVRGSAQVRHQFPPEIRRVAVQVTDVVARRSVVREVDRPRVEGGDHTTPHV